MIMVSAKNDLNLLLDLAFSDIKSFDLVLPVFWEIQFLPANSSLYNGFSKGVSLKPVLSSRKKHDFTKVVC